MNPLEFNGLLKVALAEDAARNDITSRSVIPQNSRIKAAIIAKEPGILAGIDLAARVFKLQDNNLSVRTLKRDGSAIKPGQAVLTVEGSARSIFAAERTALNLLGHLCGIATLTRAFVERTRGTHTNIYDTRKTLPGLRALEKYAVQIGGGHSHRASLAEAILIKTNHLKVLSRIPRGPQSIVHSPHNAIAECIGRAKRQHPQRFVEVEVTSLEEFKSALKAGPDAILLDNCSLPSIRKAVALRRRGPRTVDRGPLLEVSGGVTLANVRAIARTGVDRISIGRLTHSAPSLDLSLEAIR